MKEELNRITEEIIAAAIAVHHELGPGALESSYEACLTFELAERKLAFELKTRSLLKSNVSNASTQCTRRS